MVSERQIYVKLSFNAWMPSVLYLPVESPNIHDDACILR